MWGYKAKIDKADKAFSLYIKELANWKCEFCGKDFSNNRQYLQCSHYWGRVNESTRFDPNNANAFCSYHHNYLGHGEGRDDYRAFKIKQLSECGFKILEVCKNNYKKKDRKMAYIIYKQLYLDLCKSKNIEPIKV